MPNAPVQTVFDEPPQLSEDMTKRDIVDVLQHLPLRYRNSTCVVRIDRGVRDFLVRTLKQ